MLFAHRIFFLTGALRELKMKHAAAVLGARPALVHARRVYSKASGLKRMCASFDRVFRAVLRNSTAGSLDSASITPLVGRSA